MRQGIIMAKSLPESYEDFCELLASRTAVYTRCTDCAKPFEPSNTKTRAGWRETQITGMCESCFDGLFEGMPE